MRTLSWTRENDHVFGPFLYAREAGKRTGHAICVRSGCDEYPNAYFRLSLYGHTFMIGLPSWLLRPARERVEAKYWDQATIERLGRNWYYNVYPREYGISLRDGHLSFRYGQQTHDSQTDKTKGIFLPWTNWRCIRHSFCAPDGAHLKTFRYKKRGDQAASWNEEYEYSQTAPTLDYAFRDFDGEEMTASLRKEESEYLRGEGRWSWLSWFSRPKIYHRVEMKFSGETGSRKGSWKGGTIGLNMPINPGETLDQCFRRYCEEKAMEFIGPITS